MKNTKKIVAILLAVIMVFGLCACGNKPDAEKTSLSVCLASEPDTLDPALNSAVDGATMIAHLFSGLAKWSQDESGKLIIVADCAKELVEGVTNDDGTVTYTYTLKDGLKWSDGKALTAQDFVFAWNRAISADLLADYEYMFDIVDGYADGKLNVVAKDDKTLVVTIANACSYWNELLAFPVYFPVREDVVSNDKWATDPTTYICNGPYVMTEWDHDSKIVLEKNENYVDADSIKLDELVCYLSDDENNMLANFKNGAWQMIDDVPTNEMAALKADYPDEYVVVGQIGTYYVCWNVNENILPASSTLTGNDAEIAKAEIRNAISLLFDRNYVCDEIGQAGQVPASSFVAMGMSNPDGTEFYKTAGHNDGFVGYYDVAKEAFSANVASCVETLKKYYAFDEASGKFTDFPKMTYLYNTNEGHKAIGEYLQQALATVGIEMDLVNQEWNTFLNTRKDGDYSIARNGWIADYSDPICFLDMWLSFSGNNDVQYGKDGHKDINIYSLDLTSFGIDYKVENATWEETYDVLIGYIKSCTDNTTRYQLMHVAEDMLMSTGCICPLYYYTDIYMLKSNVKGFFCNPLGYKYFMYCTIED